jgi:hypothetical protein
MKKNSHEELRHQKSRYYLFYCWWTQKVSQRVALRNSWNEPSSCFCEERMSGRFHSLHNRKQDKADTRPLAQQRALCLIPTHPTDESLFCPTFWASVAVDPLCCCYFYFLDTLRRLNNDEMMGVVKKSAAGHQRNIFSLKKRKKKE